MTNRISTPIEKLLSRAPRLWLNETEWHEVNDAVTPKKRIKITVELELSPLQYRALMWTCKSLFLSPAEYTTSALVTDLDGHNNCDEPIWLAGTLEAVLALFPERERVLGELCEAYNSQAGAVRDNGKAIHAACTKLLERGMAVMV
jgi:hypothetical protein